MTDASVASRSRIADPSLATIGHRAIGWAEDHSPVVGGWLRDRLTDGALKGKRVAVVVHLEAKTAFLATVLADAGASVVAAGSNPMSTRDDVCAALVDRGIEVHSSRASTMEQWEQDLLAVAETEPEYIIDDGAELTLRMVQHRPELLTGLKGVTEQTTTGVARLRALVESGRVSCPALAANDAACKHMFDNRYGTGQSTVQAIMGLTNVLMAGKKVAVVGYGWVGRGLATYVRALGATAVVVEIDPIKALEAHMDGHQVAAAADAFPDADMIITATGGIRAVGEQHFEYLKDGVIMANAGHHDLEVDTVALAAYADSVTLVREGITGYSLGSKKVNVLAGGALVNIAGGLGHPVEIMDLSFAVQGAGCHELARGNVPEGLHIIPAELDREIAKAKLDSLGVSIDTLAANQCEEI